MIHMGIQIFIVFAMMIIAVIPIFMGAVMEADAGAYHLDEEYFESVIPQVTMNALLISAVVSTVLFYFLYRHYRKDFDMTPFRAPSIVPLVVVIGLAGNFAVMAIVTALQEIWGTDLATSTLDGMLENVNMGIFLLTVCIVVPVAEELCFRGLMFNHLSRAFSFWTANIIQAAVFGLIHGLPIQIGYAFLFGLLLGWLQRRTGRLSIAILAHIVFNSAFIPLGLIPGIEELLTNPTGLLLFLFLPSAAVTLFAIRVFDTASSSSKKTGQ
jgi:hypothetical protein